MFVGYLDVVLLGLGWVLDLFELVVCGDLFYGCGVVDMKSLIVVFVVVVVCKFDYFGCLIFIIIGDEEGFVIYGIVVLIEWMWVCGFIFDLCFVGEFILVNWLGDMIKIGWCGLVNIWIEVEGM